jgi:predicted ATPase
MAYPNSRIYQIGVNSLEHVSWQDTEHYIVAKRFLNDPEKQLSRLLE